MSGGSAHIIAAFRSIVAPRGGGLANYKLHSIAAPVIQKLLEETGLNSDRVDEVIVSNALGAGEIQHVWSLWLLVCLST